MKEYYKKELIIKKHLHGGTDVRFAWTGSKSVYERFFKKTWFFNEVN